VDRRRGVHRLRTDGPDVRLRRRRGRPDPATLGDLLVQGAVGRNPLGCAAAIASLELLREPSTARRWALLEASHRRNLSELSTSRRIEGARVLGTIAAFELPGAGDGYLAGRGGEVARQCRERGVLVRPLGDTLYVMPPWSVRRAELDRVWDALDEAIGRL